MDDKTQLKTTLRKADKLANSTKPKVKKISSYEIYLLNKKGEQTKRICGCQLNNMPEGYVCVKGAGDGTDHPGWGQCNFHNRQITNTNNTGLWLELNRKAGLPNNLMEFLENAQIVEEQHLNDVDEDIRALYAIQTYVLARRRDTENPEDGYLTNRDIELLIKITDRIFKAKELRPKLKREISLDTTTVKAFVDQVFKIVMSNAAQNVGRRILQEIVDEVIVPFKTQGRIVGDEFEYSPASEKIVQSLTPKNKEI
jgi:hypothetical protein|tara:strand:- start:512 stop:1276 length:765 start_codon:yes stop_codon:yes gene_type:complete